MDPELAFLAGMLHGASEGLPLSNIVQVVLLLENAGVDAKDTRALAFILRFGTQFALLVRLRGDVREVVGNPGEQRDDRMVRFLLVATLISLVVGFATPVGT